MQQSDNNVNRFYSDSGLTPTVLQSLAGSNTGARLAGEMAGYRSQNAQNLISAQAGGQYQQQRINQDYGDKRASLVDQLNAEQRERGTFTSSALEQLITGDRSTRHTANVEAAKQQHADAQAILDRQTQQDNALIGQGLVVGKDGTLQPLPGGKADPNAPQFQKDPAKPKKPAKPSGVDRTIQSDYKKAAAWVKQLDDVQAQKAAGPGEATRGRPGAPDQRRPGFGHPVDHVRRARRGARHVLQLGAFERHGGRDAQRRREGEVPQRHADAGSAGRSGSQERPPQGHAAGQAVPGGAPRRAPTPDQADRNRKR
jgi:hypothetical protein